MIRIVCATCGKILEVASSAAGKKGKCGACGAIIPIPAVSSPGSSPAKRAPDLAVLADQAGDPFANPKAELEAVEPSHIQRDTPYMKSPPTMEECIIGAFATLPVIGGGIVFTLLVGQAIEKKSPLPAGFGLLILAGSLLAGTLLLGIYYALQYLRRMAESNEYMAQHFHQRPSE